MTVFFSVPVAPTGTSCIEPDTGQELRRQPQSGRVSFPSYTSPNCSTSQSVQLTGCQPMKRESTSSMNRASCTDFPNFQSSGTTTWGDWLTGVLERVGIGVSGAVTTENNTMDWLYVACTTQRIYNINNYEHITTQPTVGNAIPVANQIHGLNP